MVDISEISQRIKEKLLSINPEKIILFGSYAYGNPDKDSDIDLLVVTSDRKLPSNYKEKSDLYVKVSNLLHDLYKEYPIDLIVHTEPMYKLFIEMDSLFSNEITQKGIIIYERSNKTMV